MGLPILSFRAAYEMYHKGCKRVFPATVEAETAVTAYIYFYIIMSSATDVAETAATAYLLLLILKPQIFNSIRDPSDISCIVLMCGLVNYKIVSAFRTFLVWCCFLLNSFKCAI